MKIEKVKAVLKKKKVKKIDYSSDYMLVSISHILEILKKILYKSYNQIIKITKIEEDVILIQQRCKKNHEYK